MEASSPSETRDASDQADPTDTAVSEAKPVDMDGFTPPPPMTKLSPDGFAFALPLAPPTRKKTNTTAGSVQPPPSQPKPKNSERKPFTGLQGPFNLPYIKPTWGGAVDTNICLEVLKDGSIVDNVPLKGRDMLVVGRHAKCDIILEHPSVSRVHAVLQMRENGTLYVYDLDSTHGTFWNKTQKVKPNTHVPFKVGDMLKFGLSSRLYLLGGDITQKDRDEVEQKKHEAFQKKIFDQIEAKADARKGKFLDTLQQRQRQLAGSSKAKTEKPESDDASWGMGRDADEDGEEEEEVVVQALGEDTIGTLFDDTDEFYDRTKSNILKQKRQQERAENVANGRTLKAKPVVHTEATLQAQLDELEAERAEWQTKLDKIDSNASQVEAGDIDPLDQFVSAMSRAEDQKHRKVVVTKLGELDDEISRYRKLVSMVRPAIAGLGSGIKPKKDVDQPPPTEKPATMIMKRDGITFSVRRKATTVPPKTASLASELALPSVPERISPPLVEVITDEPKPSASLTTQTSTNDGDIFTAPVRTNPSAEDEDVMLSTAQRQRRAQRAQREEEKRKILESVRSATARQRKLGAGTADELEEEDAAEEEGDMDFVDFDESKKRKRDGPVAVTAIERAALSGQLMATVDPNKQQPSKAQAADEGGSVEIPSQGTQLSKRAVRKMQIEEARGAVRREVRAPPTQQQASVQQAEVMDEDSSSAWVPPADQTGDGRTKLNDLYGY